jgi:hypothetical protein
MNGKPWFYGREARDIALSFYQQHIHITLGGPKQSNHRSHVITTSGSNDARLSLSILESANSEKALRTWQDDDGSKLETYITEIAIELVLLAEIRYRERTIHQYEWRVERKAQLEEEERKRKLESERVEQERQKRVEQARIDRLLRGRGSISASWRNKKVRRSHQISADAQ